MSNSSFRDTLNLVKGNAYKAHAVERNYWNGATPETRSILIGRDMFASEYAYQQENTARFNQLINTNFDSLPESVKASVTEALVIQGELPNPSDFKGIGNEFIANPYSVNQEIAIECDRCDEVFMAKEDFDQHKSYDHGDESVDFNQAEEQYELSMNPDVTRESLREARKLLAETKNKDLFRDSTFNYKQIKTPTLEEPKSDGVVGYNDNPNEGLYDTKKFKSGTSEDRVALEAIANEGGYCNKCGTYSYSNSMKSHMEDYHPNVPRSQWKTLEYMGSSVSGDDRYVGDDIANKYHGNSQELEKAMGWGHKDDGWSNKFDYQKEALAHEDDMDDIQFKQQFGYDWRDKTKGKCKKSKEGYELDMEDNANYDEKDSLSDITNVAPEPVSDPAKSLEGIDFSEESIEYIYPTKASEAFVEEKDPFVDSYGDDDIESDSEAVEAQIISRKLHGYSNENIAIELTRQYGVSPEEALQKAYSIEVSTNDKLANTFFGKRFNECTEAEIKELHLYSGSDNQ